MCTALWPRGYGAVYFTGNDNDMPDRFKNISKEITHDTAPMDAVRDYSISVTDRPNYSTWDAKHDEFLRSKKTSEVFFDPFTKEVVKQVIPLKIVSPEADIILAGRAALAAALKAGIVLRKEAYKLGPVRIGPVTAKKMKRAGSMLNKKLIVDKVKDKAEEDVEKAVFGKTKQDLISEQYHKMVDNLGSEELSVDDVIKQVDDFYDYYSSANTLNRIKEIDNELGTKYYDVISNYLRNSKLTNNKVPQDISFETPILDSNKIPTRAKAVTRYYKSLFTNPSLQGTTIALRKDAPKYSLTHEETHAIDIAEQAMRKKPKTKKDLFDYSDNKRIQNLVDKDNLNNIEDALDLYVKENKYGNRDFVERIKNEIIDRDDEMAAYLSRLGETRRIKGKPLGSYTYKSLDELEDDIYNSGYILRQGEIDPLEFIYRYFIKDKNRFMDRVNKYSFVYPGTVILSPGNKK